jgi:hypothetical protein
MSVPGARDALLIVAEADPCYLFAGWTVESGSATIADPGAAHVTFTMESLDTTLQASFVCDPACDVDTDGVCDGLIFTYFDLPHRLQWLGEVGFSSWNCYKGDLSVLKTMGVYTQSPGPPRMARRYCDLSVSWVDDAAPLDSGECAFYLAAGVTALVEGDLGSLI